MTPTPDQQALIDFTKNRASTAMDPQSIQAIIDAKFREYQADLAAGIRNPNANFVKVGPLALDTAPLVPLKLPSPIKSVVLKDATDDTVRVKLIVNTDAQFAVDNAYPLDHNEAVNFGDAVPLCYLTWDAQPTKTATLYLGIDAEIRPGKIISVQSGGVSISEGSSITTRANAGLNLASKAQAIVCPQDSTRKTERIYNGTGVDLWLGGANVTDPAGGNPGEPWPNGSVYEHKSAAALYAYNPGAAALNNAQIGRNFLT